MVGHFDIYTYFYFKIFILRFVWAQGKNGKKFNNFFFFPFFSPINPFVLIDKRITLIYPKEGFTEQKKIETKIPIFSQTFSVQR